MKLDTLEIQQFRGIKNLKLKNLGDVNLLLGNNDAGKTTVLEAINMFGSSDNIDTIIRNSRTRLSGVMLLSRDNYMPLESLLHLFPFDQEHKELALHAEFDGQPDDLKIAGELVHVLRPVSEEELEGGYIRSDRKRKNESLTEREVLTFQGTFYSNGKEEPFSIDEFYRYQISFIGSPNMSRPITYMAPGDHLSGRNRLSIYKTSKKQELEIVKLLRLIDPDIEGFKLQPNSTTSGSNQVIEHRRFGDVPLYTYGDGMKKILSLAAGVLRAKSGILMVDEIETSLQASNLKHVFTWLLNACKLFDVQLFVTTHSLESVSTLASCAVADTESELTCYRLEKDWDGLFAKRFSESDLDSMVNGRGIDVR